MIHGMHVAFKTSYVYDFNTNLCRQTEVLQNNDRRNMRNRDKAKLKSRNVTGLNLAAEELSCRLCSISQIKYDIMCFKTPGVTQASYILCTSRSALYRALRLLSTLKM